MGIKFPCESCDYLASHKSYIRKHVKSVHEGIKFSCESCDYLASYKSENQTLEHIYNQYMKERSFLVSHVTI